MAGTFPPDYFAPDYFAPDYFGGKTDANAMSVVITGVATVTADLTAASSSLEATINGSATVAGSLTDGAAVVVPIKPPGGDDAPRSHVGVLPRLVKDKKRRKQIKRDELEELYDRIQGIEPQTKAGQRAIAAVQKAVAPSASELPPTLDWAAIESDLKAAIAIRKAYEIIQDEEDAVIALLLAA
jgi:hypothetical protein